MKKIAYIIWWKIDNLLMSSEQMREVGIYPPKQMKLWIDGRA